MLNFHVLDYREAAPETILSKHHFREMLPYRLLCDGIFESEVAFIEGIEQWLTTEMFSEKKLL